MGGGGDGKGGVEGGGHGEKGGRRRGGGRGRSGRRLGEGMINVSFNDTFCACTFIMYRVPQLLSGMI